ncbi:hypothetical protein NDU88_002926 [Pleurodeles waltl]|uniref:Uncharacterized protein n=1 Tax=Pleurodeles waltl TaxID=8319 RepID=A0AAV7MRZ3_PLEWA|nr:hypothetical protein NDU88_002926 [Pleurodeles waltl]
MVQPGLVLCAPEICGAAHWDHRQGVRPRHEERDHPQTSVESTNCIGAAEGEPLEHRREPWGSPVGTSELLRAPPEHDRGPRKAWCGLVLHCAHLRSAEQRIGTAMRGTAPARGRGSLPDLQQSTNHIGAAEGEPLEHQRDRTETCNSGGGWRQSKARSAQGSS